MADPERYATIQQLRDEGLTEGGDDQLKTWLDRASSLVEKTTRNFFYEVAGIVTFDGNGSHILHLPFPIREVTSLKVNGSTDAMDAEGYRAYIGNTPLADFRKNPKIELRRGASSSIFTGTGQSLVFRKGLDQTIEGKFGYLEPPISPAVTDRVPPVVNECVMAIVMSTAVSLYDRFGFKFTGSGGGELIGSLKREKVDDHEIEFHEVDDSSMLEGTLFVPYIENRLKGFKAPTAVKVTSARWFEGGSV